MTDETWHYRWQETAHRILGELVAEGRQHRFPALVWTLATTGALTGEATSLTTTTHDQRDAITRWARHLGATVTETPHNDGRISLCAPFNRQGERRGVLRAELYPADDN